MENIFVEFLPPWVETGLQPAFYDKESGTVLQQTARMYSRVNMLIRMFNKLSKNTKTTVEDYINKFNELHDYVHDYFDNLDVQEEINNKLDDMADSGELADIIVEYYSNSTDVIFPTYNIDGNSTLGDCSIIKTPNKAIMIDTFSNSSELFDGIVSALRENGITSLDYFLISHYDSDHIGNLQRIIDAHLLDNARIILPRDVDNANIHMTGETVKLALESAGLTWELADNETIDIDNDVTMRLFNASASDYAYYDGAGETNYNNYSVFAEITAHGRRALFPGDALTTACDYVSKHYITEGRYDLIKDNHHGFAGYSVDYSKKVAPQNVLIPASPGMMKSDLGYRGALRGSWGLYTDSIYYQGCQNTPVKFNLNHDGVHITSNVYCSEDPGTDYVFQYYIDATTTDKLRTGSEEHPFKNFSEANAMSPKNSAANVRFNVVHLGNETNQVYFSGYKKLQINFYGETPKNNLSFFNIGMLRLNDVVLDSTTITIEDCPSVLITDLTSTATVNDQVIITRSRVEFDGVLESTNAIYSFLKVTYSDLNLAATTLNFTQASSDARILSVWQDNITCATTTTPLLKNYPFTTVICTARNAKQNNWSNLEDLCTLYESDTTVYTNIPLAESLNYYRALKVECYTDEGHTLTETFNIASGTTNHNVMSGYTNGAGTGFYMRNCRIRVSGTTLNTDRQRQISIDAGAYPSIQSSETGYIGVRRVIGLL